MTFAPMFRLTLKCNNVIHRKQQRLHLIRHLKTFKLHSIRVHLKRNQENEENEIITQAMKE